MNRMHRGRPEPRTAALKPSTPAPPPAPPATGPHPAGRRRPLAAVASGVGAVVLAAAFGILFWPKPTAEELWTRAREEVGQKRYADALATLDRVGALRAPTAADLFTRSEAESELGRADAAIATLDKVPDGDPMGSTARMVQGQLELRRQRLVAAEALLLRAHALDPAKVKPLRELIYIYGMQLRRAELNRIFRALTKLAMLESSEVYLWTLARGVTWEPEEVVAYLTKCVAADPGDRYSRLGLAESLRQINRLSDAEATLAPLPPDDADARAIRVRMAIDRSDDAAIDALLAEGPAEHLDLALLRGRVALARGEGPAAVDAFRIAHRLDPISREANQGLARALTLVGKPDEAAPFQKLLPRFDRLETLMQKAAVVKNREDPALIRDLGAACLALGRRPEAHAWYRLAVRADPADVEAQRGAAESAETPEAPEPTQPPSP